MIRFERLMGGEYQENLNCLAMRNWFMTKEREEKKQ